MRLSSLQVYQQSLNGINKISSEIVQTQNQISTGQRVNIGSDDPVATARILAVEAELNNINRYQKNIDAVDSQLNRTEKTLSNIETILDRLNELVIQADGAGMTNVERRNIAIEIDERLLELASLTNSQDEDGDYIFSGFSTDSPAFILEDGRYRYQGDDSVRHEKVAENITVVSSDNGHSLFDNFTVSDYYPSVEMSVNNTSATQSVEVRLVDQDAYNILAVAADSLGYEITFNSVNNISPAGPNYDITYTSTGVNIIQNVPYDHSLGLLDGGLEINFNVSPTTGDAIIIRASNQSNMLNIVNDIADRIATFAEPTSATDRGEEEAFDLFIADSLDALSAIQERIRSSRTSIGARMNTLTSASDNQESLTLVGNQILSDIRDLDYNEAVSRLSFQTLVLETTQQSFVKIANLSLFNFLR